MRFALVLSLLALGCTEDPPSGGPAVDSHVETYDFAPSVPPELDLLIVLDHTTAMAPHQTALAALPAGLAAALTSEDGLQPDTRIAVTTVDGAGAFRQPSTSTDAYLALGLDVHYDRAANYTGTLTDALAQLLAVGAAAAVTSQPLASAKAALDAHPSFARSQASLGIVTITASDDASSGMILDYSNGLKARKSDPTEVAVSSIYPAASTRLDSFHAQFPNRATTQDIATADYSAPLGVIEGLLKTVLGIPCATEPADVDAATPGAQYECDLNAYFEDDTSQAIRQCKDDNSVAPCFRFSIDVGCQDGTKRFVVTGFPTRWVPPVRGQCVVTGQN